MAILKFNFLQAGGKSDVVSEKAAKRLKVGIAADVAKATARSSDSTAAVASPRAEMMADKNKLVDIVLSPSQKVNTAMVLQESTSFKQQIRPLAPAGPPFLMNRYKLDNRPTAFRIIPPLPVGFADVSSSSFLSSPPPFSCFNVYGVCRIHFCIIDLGTGWMLLGISKP